MYPMADMLNHEFGSTDVAITEGKGGEMCFQISSGRDVKEGHQVMLTRKSLLFTTLHSRILQSKAEGVAFPNLEPKP